MRPTPLVLIVAVTGCTQTVRFPPDLRGGYEYDYTYDYGTETDVDTGTAGTVPTELRVVDAVGGCDAVDGALTFDVRTDGWTGLATFTLHRAVDGRSEDHPMDLVALDPAGAWDEWRVELASGATATDWVPSETTAFDCDAEGAALSFAVRLDRQLTDGSVATVDCVVWGADVGSAASDLVFRDPDLSFVQDCRVITL